MRKAKEAEMRRIPKLVRLVTFSNVMAVLSIGAVVAFLVYISIFLGVVQGIHGLTVAASAGMVWGAIGRIAVGVVMFAFFAATAFVIIHRARGGDRY